jgi:hypothetical protein
MKNGNCSSVCPHSDCLKIETMLLGLRSDILWFNQSWWLVFEGEELESELYLPRNLIGGPRVNTHKNKMCRMCRSLRHEVLVMTLLFQQTHDTFLYDTCNTFWKRGLNLFLGRWTILFLKILKWLLFQFISN